jgi:hypothetical protein
MINWSAIVADLSVGESRRQLRAIDKSAAKSSWLGKSVIIEDETFINQSVALLPILQHFERGFTLITVIPGCY